MNGLLGQGAPVVRLSRSVLPPSESRSRGLVPIAASPVPTYNDPSRAISSRQPPCRPLEVGKPLTRVRTSLALVVAGLSRHAITRTSWPLPDFQPLQV